MASSGAANPCRRARRRWPLPPGPVTFSLSPGPDADLTHAEVVVGDRTPGAVLGDKGYDREAFVGALPRRGIEVVIPPTRNRKEQRAYDRVLDSQRNEAERGGFGQLPVSGQVFGQVVLLPEIPVWEQPPTFYGRTPGSGVLARRCSRNLPTVFMRDLAFFPLSPRPVPAALRPACGRRGRPAC